MTELEVCDNIGLLNEKMGDINYLMQEIREEYFERFDGHKKKDEWRIACEHNRYAALFRILDICIYEIAENLITMDKALNNQLKCAN